MPSRSSFPNRKGARDWSSAATSPRTSTDRDCVRRFGGYAKADASATGWLVAAATASAAAYAAGMFTFDAMGFTQVTFLLFVILGLGAAAAARGREASRAE